MVYTTCHTPICAICSVAAKVNVAVKLRMSFYIFQRTSVCVQTAWKPVQSAWALRDIFVKRKALSYSHSYQCREMVAPVEIWKQPPRKTWSKTRGTDRKIDSLENTTCNVKMYAFACVKKDKRDVQQLTISPYSSVVFLRQPQMQLCSLKSPKRSNWDGRCLTTCCRSSARQSQTRNYKQQIVIFTGCNKLIATTCSGLAI